MDAQLERLTQALADRYTIEREIGRGGMATVYLAEDLKHHRKVAVKVLDPELAAAVGADRFLREIEIAANLTHPHILPVHDSGEAEGFLYFVMPFVEGESLRDRLDRERQLPIDDAIRVTREVAEALDFAHERGVIHRDVKPANILLEAGHAVLADFGIAKAAQEAGSERITRTGVAVGTPAYMSPEQALGEEELDGRSDQYALGCVLYEMLGGDAPYVASTPQAVIAKKLNDPVPRVRVVRETVPAALEAALAKALAKSPADRYSTTAELAAALELTTAPIEERRRLGRGRAVIFGGTVILGLAAVAVLASRWSVAVRLLGGSPPTGSAPLVAAADDKPSIALLPVDVSSLTAEDAGFAEGMAEAIHSRLIPVSGLAVKARYSADQYDIGGKTFRQIGEELGAEYLLDLRTRREEDPDRGPRVRVAANLIRASDERIVWGEPYEEGLESIFSLHRNIAERVVQELDVALAASERQALLSDPTRDPQAWDYYQQGVQVARSGASRSINLQAAELLERAVAEDSTFALAYAGLAVVLFVGGYEESTRRAREALSRARQLDPDLPEIREAQASQYYAYGQWEEAAEEWRAVLRSRPSNAHLLENLGLVARRLGRWEEALEYQNRAFELDSRRPNTLLNLGLTHLWLRNYDEAEWCLERWAELLGEVLGEEGRQQSAGYRAWLKLADRGDVAGAEQVFRQAAEQVGLEWVLARMVRGERGTPWFGLADWGFRQDLRDSSPTTLGHYLGQDPLLPLLFSLARAASEQAEGNRAAAMTYYDSVRVVLEAGYDNFGAGAHSFLGIVYAGLGRGEDAIREAEEGVRLGPLSSDAFAGGDHLRDLARVCVMVGEYERAIEVLDTLLTVPSKWSANLLRVHTDFEPLRDHPRFQALLEKHGAAGTGT